MSSPIFLDANGVGGVLGRGVCAGCDFGSVKFVGEGCTCGVGSASASRTDIAVGSEWASQEKNCGAVLA